MSSVPPEPTVEEAVLHCVDRVAAISGHESISRLDLFGIGYNLGRLSELTGLGREPFWDRWKTAVEEGSAGTLRTLAERLRAESSELVRHAELVERTD